jgi:hypothetical protein
MSAPRKANQFIRTCLIGGIVGVVFLGIGTLIYRYSFSEQRRLWTPSKFAITDNSLKDNSEYNSVSFTPKGKERHFVKICISPMSSEQHERMRKVPTPSVDWQVLHGGQPVEVKNDVTRSWGWSSSDGACADLGMFQGMIGQEHQIKFRLNRLTFSVPNSRLYLIVRPDVMATKGRMTMYQLTGVMFQLIGVAIFGFSVFKGLINLLKADKARKSEV